MARPTAPRVVRTPPAVDESSWRLGPGRLLGIVVGLFSLLPNTIVRTKVELGTELVAIALLAAALAAVSVPRRWGAAPTLLAVYLTCLVLSVTHYGTVSNLLGGLRYAVMLLLALLVAANLDARERRHLVSTILVVAAFQLAVTAAEQAGVVPAPWGYLGQSGSTFNENNVLPFLSGEATGTMGHPIPLGALLTVAALMCLFARPQWRWQLRWIAALAFAVGVAFSGSRSAFLALIIAAVVGVLLPTTFRNAGRARLFALAVVLLGALFGNVQNSTLLSSLDGTGSLSHRLDAINSVSKLMGRDTVQVLFGSGFDATQRLFQLRLLQLDNFTAIDNQLVSCLALGGLVGVLAVVALFFFGLFRGDRATRSAGVAVFLMFFSFDLLEWYAAALLFVTFVALGSSRRDEHPLPDEPERPGRPDATASPRSVDTTAVSAAPSAPRDGSGSVGVPVAQ